MKAVFLSVGLSHKQAPIAIRELIAVSAEVLPDRLKRLRQIGGIREAMLVSTCNRLELFAVAEAASLAADLVAEMGPAAAPYAVVRADEEALRHLFRVASSLDSMVVGEAQILGQLKDAAQTAQELGHTGPHLNLAMARAIQAAKRVRTDTGVARGLVSVSSVAVDLANKVLGDLSGRSVVLIGAGEMAQLAARELQKRGAKELLIANRSPGRAEELAASIGGVAVNLLELPALLERVDVAICSAGASLPLITREMMVRAAKARRFRPIFLIDLALPRNVEPSVNGLENIYVYDMDDLERVAAQNRGLREGELAKAEAIVEEELRAFLASRKERTDVPVLARLRAHAQTVAEAEIAKTLAALGTVSERQEKSVRAMAAAIVNKLLHGPTQRLRKEAGGGPLAEAVAELFELPSQPTAEAAEAAAVATESAAAAPKAEADKTPAHSREGVVDRP